MGEDNRTRNSIRNMKVNLICQLAALLANFVVRTVFIRTLSEEYFGINGLFSNILSILSLAEMGIGNAIVFGMYLPLAKGDRPKVKALMGYYKKVYAFLGIFIACAGLALIPFLQFFMKDQPQIENLVLIHCLYLLGTVLTYFYAHKRAIIIADQNMYIVALYQNGMQIILFLVQAAVLYITHNFILYLVIQAAASFLGSAAISRKADRMYPYLREKTKDRLNRADQKQIGGNVRALFLHRFGDVIVNNTDNVLISALVGVSSVGYYSNYILISSAVSMVINQLFEAFTASVGNLNSLEKRDTVYQVYNPLLFFSFGICGFGLISMYYLFNPFIECWVGNRYLLPAGTVLVVCINFYLLQMRKVNLIFKEAMGLFKEDRYRALAEALINLVVSVILGMRYGIVGILAGTTISIILTTFWLEPWVLFRYGFGQNVSIYFRKFLFYSVAIYINFIITGVIIQTVPFSGLAGLAAKMAVCITVPNLLFCLAFFRQPEFRLILELVKRQLKAKKKK